MKKITTLAVSLLTAACMSAGALAADQPLEKVAPFPKAEKGMKRQVIQLPQQQDESALKVELMIGQTLEVDCNQSYLVQQVTIKSY
ncbi:ecotin family protein, partial [Klebsiella pneumoniae]|uniref:ecotin family protein n=1 Tax=Klebsiella pneumoniae TaxID=573 RepID=UPI003969AB61